MKALLLLLSAAVIAGCSYSDPCDMCNNLDYYVDHPYFCDKCINEGGCEECQGDYAYDD